MFLIVSDTVSKARNSLPTSGQLALKGGLAGQAGQHVTAGI